MVKTPPARFNPAGVNLSKSLSSKLVDLSQGVDYKDITIGVPKEVAPGERRVAQVPGQC